MLKITIHVHTYIVTRRLWADQLARLSVCLSVLALTGSKFLAMDTQATHCFATTCFTNTGVKFVKCSVPCRVVSNRRLCHSVFIFAFLKLIRSFYTHAELRSHSYNLVTALSFWNVQTYIRLFVIYQNSIQFKTDSRLYMFTILTKILK